MRALDIANYLIYLMGDVCDDLTNMKINKLLYYAQGHHFRKFGTPLFEDTIEAWDHGPVVAEVYTAFKDMGDNPITEYDASRIDAVSDEDADFLVDVAREYGKYTASALRNMTHRLGGPWDQYYCQGRYHAEIPATCIRDYFQSDKEHDIDLVIPEPSEEDFVGYRNADGMLVLPKEWNDGEA